MLIVVGALTACSPGVGGYDVCVCAADKKSIRELGAWDEPNATNQLSGLAPAAESRREKDGGGEGKTRKRCLGQGRS